VLFRRPTSTGGSLDDKGDLVTTTDSRLDAEVLMAAAVEQTGLDDFGPPSFREGLDVYCASVPEAQLNDLGNAVVPGNIVGALSNRLKVVDWGKTHPKVADETIEAPFVVVGIFRAGTTFLSYLLEKDDRHRPLFGWEAQDSVPPPDPAHMKDDPRIAATVAGRAMLDSINPMIKVVQNEEPDGPTECIGVLNQDFKSLVWEALTNVPTYGAWLHATDHLSAYEYHHTVLQTLQSGGVRGRWSLKSPHHVLHLDALTAVYPDARIVVMHRDPAVLAASVCSLISTLTGTFSDADHTVYIADHWTDMLERSVAALDGFRDANPEVPIVDVQYAELVGDPVTTMERVYGAFGDELTGQARDAMRDHVESRPKGRFGKHKYDLDEFGLDGPALAERFAGYVERYQIPLESRDSA
jgi:hypothetical protein